MGGSLREHDSEAAISSMVVGGDSNRTVALNANPSSNDHDGYSNQKLLWVILIGLLFALIIQSLAANLGVTTGN